MFVTVNRKNKINLSDYNYQVDIENRLAMAEFTVFEVEVLREILNGSLKTSIAGLARLLDTSVNSIMQVLPKLSRTKLFTVQGDTLLVDKEIRKYYEFQITKFNEDFAPNIEFLQSLLSRVPIHVLPLWYTIPRTADNIFNSIIEKYLQTPKIYERYLHEIQFDEPIMRQIMEEVFNSPELKVRTQDLIDKFRLNRLKLEELLLHMEFNFVCCLSYSRSGDVWEEVVTPFYEWREYLLFFKQTHPQSITDVAAIAGKKEGDFPFLTHLGALLKSVRNRSIAVSSEGHNYAASSEVMKGCLPMLANQAPQMLSSYFSQIISQSLILQLASLTHGQFEVLASAEEWLKKSVQEQASVLFKLPITSYRGVCFDPAHNMDRSMREIERNLKRVSSKGWVFLEDFIKGMVGTVGTAEPVILRCKGKRWRYNLPTYTPEEKLLIEMVICERFFEMGMVSIGTFNGQPCFCVTPFGRMAIEN